MKCGQYLKSGVVIRLTECQGHDKQAKVLVDAPGENEQRNRNLYIIIMSY